MSLNFSFKEIISAFIVLFAIIDITGSLPIILDLRSKGAKIGPLKVSLISFSPSCHGLRASRA